jgi:hypothetical protein
LVRGIAQETGSEGQGTISEVCWLHWKASPSISDKLRSRGFSLHPAFETFDKLLASRRPAHASEEREPVGQRHPRGPRLGYHGLGLDEADPWLLLGVSNRPWNASVGTEPARTRLRRLLSMRGLQVRVVADSGASAGFNEHRLIAVVEMGVPLQVTRVEAWRVGGCFGDRPCPLPDHARRSRRGGAQAFR